MTAPITRAAAALAAADGPALLTPAHYTAAARAALASALDRDELAAALHRSECPNLDCGYTTEGGPRQYAQADAVLDHVLGVVPGGVPDIAPEPEPCSAVTFRGSRNPDSPLFGPDEHCERAALPGADRCAYHTEGWDL